MCWKNFGYSSRSTHSTFTIFWIFNAAGEALLRACCWQLDDDEQIPCKVAPLAACQCLSPVTCRSSPALALALALTLTATLMQCSRCQRVLCVLYHIPCYVIQRPQGRKRRREGGGGQLLHSMCAAGSGIISNCVCTFAMQQQHLLLLFLQLLVPLERLDVCNLPAQHILHKLPLPLFLCCLAASFLLKIHFSACCLHWHFIYVCLCSCR